MSRRFHRLEGGRGHGYRASATRMSTGDSDLSRVGKMIKMFFLTCDHSEIMLRRRFPCAYVQTHFEMVFHIEGLLKSMRNKKAVVPRTGSRTPCRAWVPPKESKTLFRSRKIVAMAPLGGLQEGITYRLTRVVDRDHPKANHPAPTGRCHRGGWLA